MKNPLRGRRGQATVEYLVVGLVLVVVVAGIAALWRFVSGGGLADLTAASASHTVGGLGGAVDVLLY